MLKKTIFFLFSVIFVSFLLISVSFSQTDNSLAEKVANAYGFKNIKNVKSVSFTFNVRTKDKLVVRNWYWEPGADKVTYKGKGEDGKEITYSYVTGTIDRNDTIKTFVDARFNSISTGCSFLFISSGIKKQRLQMPEPAPILSVKKSRIV